MDALKVTDIIASELQQMGYELLGIEWMTGSRTLRIFIDKDGGIVVDDCAKVSNQVSFLLESSDFADSRYNLEVSSPGIDRPLFTLEHYQQFVGSEIKIALLVPIENKRKLQGKLLSCQDEVLRLQIDGAELEVPFHHIKKGNLRTT